MESVCIEERMIDKHTREGLSILARIIARDFMASQEIVKDEEGLNNDENSGHLQDK